mmetsp:Transcript_17387/g.28878  ORF Transcript_17387/g.28878 Transcript_17387/m.28878 type:complete len:98 (-) Transcript_17387:672-965(-)
MCSSTETHPLIHQACMFMIAVLLTSLLFSFRFFIFFFLMRQQRLGIIPRNGPLGTISTGQSGPLPPFPTDIVGTACHAFNTFGMESKGSDGAIEFLG